MSWNLSAFADEAAGPIEEQIKALQRAGYHFIDIRGANGHNISGMPLDVAKTIKEKLDAAGIKVSMFGSPMGKIDIADDLQVDLDRLRHMATLAPVLDCRSIRIFSYYNKNKLPMSQWRDESIQRLSTLRAEALKLGMKLYHENESHIFGDHPAENLDILKTLRDGKAFFGIFDFSNYNMGGDDVWQAWEMLKNHTDCFHLKDSTKEKQHVPVGQGNGRARDILTAALKSGWQGPLTLEPHVSHSNMVLATGPSGEANIELSKLSTQDSFHVAAVAARKLLQEIGAPVA